MLGILPALAVVWVRKYVKEPEVWVKNRQLQREQEKEVRAPLFTIFKPHVLINTLTACLWMASGFVIYYSIWALFATHLQKDLSLSPAHDRRADRHRQSGGVPGQRILGHAWPTSSAAAGR